MTLPTFQKRLFRPTARLLATILLACVSATMFARVAVPHPKRKEAYKEQVEKMEQAWRTAQLGDDVAAMEKLLSDDYIGITVTGQVVTKSQQLDRMRNRQLLVTKIDLDELKVKLIGTTAIVTSLADVDGTNEGLPMHGLYRYTRVYSRLAPGVWKITNFEATRVGPPPPPLDGRRPRGRELKQE